MIRFFGATDPGLVRQTNQDYYECGVISDTLSFAVLCDGMGGQNGGGIASETATRFAADMLRRDLHDDISEQSLRSVMLSAVAGANALVYDRAVGDEDLAGMGTTLIVAVFFVSSLYVCYVGDSRVYTATPTQEQQLTKDHTVVQMLVDIGEITEEDAQSHPKRHYITKAIGVASSVDADFVEYALAPDELTLICSDGLYHYLTPGSLYAQLHRCVKEESAESLVALAKEGGGTDNITVIVAAQGHE